jgi:hypothetical protein
MVSAGLKAMASKFKDPVNSIGSTVFVVEGAQVY